MTLDEFLKKKGSPTARDLAEKSGVSYTTIKSVRKGMKVKLYAIAKAISDATGGKVSVEALCEEAGK